MSETQFALEFNDVVFGYTKEPLLRKLSLKIGTQESVALVGSNGSGKTTVVRLALGLDVPRSGQIRLLNRNVSWGTHFAEVGYIGDPSHSDDNLGLPSWLTVKEIVDAHRLISEIHRQSEFAKDISARLAIPQLYSREIRYLSSGERRRLMTYLALSKKPKLLIADEATEIVSAQDRPTIIKCVNNCCKEFKTALLWISHDADSTAQITDRVLLLEDGKTRYLPERKLLLRIEKDGRTEEAKTVRERQALYQVRDAIQNDEFQRLHMTIEREGYYKEYEDR